MGYFIGTRPGYLAFKQKAHQRWEVEGAMDIFSLPWGFLVFRFDNKDDKRLVVKGGPWFFFGRIFILKGWSTSKS